METSCFLNRIQKAPSIKEKMDGLDPLRSPNLHVGFSDGLCSIVSCVGDGVWLTIELRHSYRLHSSEPSFLSTFDS